MTFEDLFDIVDHPAARDALRCYFTEWSGRRFESLGLTNDQNYDQNRITATDIAAVRLLNVDVPSRRIIDLLEGDLGAELSALLLQIPTGVDLGTPEAGPLIAKGSPASQAWDHLAGKTGSRWVTAGKLLARKRPRLIPVYDSVVRCVLAPPPQSFWAWLDEQLQVDAGRLQVRLAELHADLGLPNRVSTIRVFDVVVWMFH